jgi:UDP-glucose 4-epimerase
MESILVTGGAGYIGSHTVLELLLAKFNVIVVDNFSNSSRLSLDRVAALSGRSVTIVEGDLRDQGVLDGIFLNFDILSVIHFAGLKSVGESVSDPISYYDHNVLATVNLLMAMKCHGVKQIVFSSSATVYGVPVTLPLLENMALGEQTNPYGRSKYMIEAMLCDLHKSDGDWSIVILRYFNPVGAHSSGMIGEDSKGIPNNLMPYVTQTAIGRLPEVQIFGNDYDTADGTGVRDYIHVVDLAKGHLAAVNMCQQNSGLERINLGTGFGVSVLDLITTFSKVNKVKVPFSVVERRPGDVAICVAGVKKAQELLGWRATLNLADMCRDSWNWQSLNPDGYKN